MTSWKSYLAGAGAGTTVAATAVVLALLALAVLGFDGWAGDSSARGADRATLARARQWCPPAAPSLPRLPGG